MSRIDHAARNILYGMVGNVLVLISGFVLRTAFIHILGITLLGVNGLYTNVLSVLSLAEFGIGTAISYSLYKPVADDNLEQIKVLMRLFQTVYRAIAAIVTILGLLLVPFLKYLIKDPGAISIRELTIYYLIFLFNTVSTYFISYKYSLLNAQQKNYIQIGIQVVTLMVITTCQIIMLLVFRNFTIYLLTAAVIGLLQKFLVNHYFKRSFWYLSDKNIRALTREEIAPIKKNMIAIFYHKLGEVSIGQTNNIIISSLISVTTVGLLSNYNIIILAVFDFILIIFNSVVSSLGNLIATERKERQFQIFKVYRFLAFWIYGFFSVALAILITPFITLWIGEAYRMTDSVVLLIMLDYYLKGHRTIIHNFKIAAGILNVDKYIAVIQAAVNLVTALILVRFFGLKGVFIANLISGLIANLTKPFFLYKPAFDMKTVAYYKDSLRYGIIISAIYVLLLLVKSRVLHQITVNSFLFMLLIVILLPNLLLLVLFHKSDEFIYLIQVIRSKYSKNIRWDRLMEKLKGGVGLIVVPTENLKGILIKTHSKVIRNSKKYIKDKVARNYIKIRYKQENKTVDNTKVPYISREQLLLTFEDVRQKTRYQLHTYSTQDKIQSVLQQFQNKFDVRKSPVMDRYSWPNGLLALALEYTYEAKKDVRDIHCLVEYYDKWIYNNASVWRYDQALNGYTLLYLYQLTEDEKYDLAIKKIIHQIYQYPCDSQGSISLYRERPGDITIDSIGLLCPFLCRYGVVYNDQNAIELAARHIENYMEYGIDQSTLLPYHGYHANHKKKYGIIGWGRGVGWLLIGMVDSLAYMNKTETYYKHISRSFRMIIEEVVKYQKPCGNYPWQLSATEGPVDTSATAMISYALKRGVMLRILDPSFLSYSELGLLALLGSVEHGEVMNASAESTGFGIYPQRYGNYPWAQGPGTALLALVLSDKY